MTRESFAESLIRELGKPGAIKSLKSSIAAWATKKGSNAQSFFTDTLEIVREK